MESGEGGIGRIARLGAIALCLLVANCAQPGKYSKYGAASPRVVAPGEPVPKGGGVYRVGKPYIVADREYAPEENVRYRENGLASWYGEDFHGRLTANGEVFDMQAISAAHPTLPLPSYVRVTNLANKRSMVVRVNDRGPFVGNRVIDLSYKAAHLLGFGNRGVVRVRVEYVGPAGLEGSDDRQLMATLRQGEPAPVPRPVLARATEISAAQPIRNPAELAPLTPPVSAPAPVRYDERAAVISGRGLY
jgi:peptidoglycan lytic transglycosylase